MLEFPQKAVVEAEGCPITLFEMDATHELDHKEWKLPRLGIAKLTPPWVWSSLLSIYGW